MDDATPPGGFSPLPTSSAHSPVPYGSLSQQHRANYANLMRGVDVAMTNNAEFHIQNEDFPALPGANLDSSQENVLMSSHSVASTLELGSDVCGGGGGVPSGMTASLNQEQGSIDRPHELPNQEGGIITHANGHVTGIPPSMLADQFGMTGLLTYLRQAEQSNIVSLALGTDLTTLGLNLNLNERHLYTTFGGPWADFPCRTQDLDAKVPDEYLTNATIRDKLPNIKLNKLSEDVLFFLFYNCPGEVYQMAAASELYGRDWRFHKKEGVWLTRSQYGGVKEQTSTFERGSYNVFDPLQWRKIPKDMRLEYRELEERPKLPSNASSSGTTGASVPATGPGASVMAVTAPGAPAAGPPASNGGLPSSGASSRVPSPPPPNGPL